MQHYLIYVLFFSFPFLGLNGCKNPEAKKRSDTENCKDIMELDNEFLKLDVMVKKLQTEEFSQSRLKLKSLCENINGVPGTLICQDETGKAIDVAIITNKCNDLDNFLKPYEEYFAEVPGLDKGNGSDCLEVAKATTNLAQAVTTGQTANAKAKLCATLNKPGENYRCEVNDKSGNATHWESKTRLHKKYCQ
jgi:hypothetical protein